MIDAVLSYHLNPFACGVARFNLQLATRLGVPCLPLGMPCAHPLISIKTAECWTWTDYLPAAGTFDLLLHDRPMAPGAIAKAAHVWYADEIGCPSTLEGNPTRGDLHVLLFGMAHKIHVHAIYVERLRDLLDRSRQDYTVSVSTSVHEAQPWDEIFTRTIAVLRRVFGDHLRVLGYLADDALARELRECSACALFFDPAARANNTSLWAALEAGCTVVTNLDRHSPPELRHQATVFDIAQMTDWPREPELTAVAGAGPTAAQARSWDALLMVLRG